MKTAILVITIALLVSCSSLEPAFSQNDAVRLFTAMTDNPAYSEQRFMGDDAAMISDLAETECPEIEGDFVRAVYADGEAKLVLYASPQGNVQCAIFRPAPAKEPVYKTKEEAPSENVVLTVNGAPVTLETVDLAAATLPEGTELDQNALGAILNAVINEELIRQEAAKMETAPEDIAAARAALLNATEEAPGEAWLGERALRQAQLQRLVAERLLSETIPVTDDAARAYYMSNTNQFLRTEQAVMRHIFVANEGRTQEQVQDRVRRIADEMNTSDFCKLAATYSDDKRNECGVYVLPRGIVDPALEYASFSTPGNATTVVTTQAGVHFVQTLQVMPAQVVPYGQIAGQLQETLRASALQERLNLYVSLLRSRADIVVYLAQAS